MQRLLTLRNFDKPPSNHEIVRQKNAFISNSGTCTSCLADFIKLPNPALRAIKSFSSLIVGKVVTGDVFSSPFFPLRSGDVERVSGKDNISTSILIDERRRKERSSWNIGIRVIVGLGGSETLSESIGVVGVLVSLSARRGVTEGLSKDQERTRSSARTWQPVYAH